MRLIFYISKVSVRHLSDWSADQDTFTRTISGHFPGGSTAGACRSLQEVFVRNINNDIPAYLSVSSSYWLLWPPPAVAQVQGDCGKYLGGILMRIIERHLYFTLLPLPSYTDHISDLQPHNIWRTETNSIGFGW